MKKLDIGDKIKLCFKKNMVAHCCMQFDKDSKGNHCGYFYSSFPITFRERELEGVLNHEIGTHYLRGYNERS